VHLQRPKANKAKAIRNEFLNTYTFDSQQTSLDRTISSAHFVPQGYDVEHNEARPTGASKTYAENVRRPLKRKIRDIPRQRPSKVPKSLVAIVEG
jgi:hypothetical protein